MKVSQVQEPDSGSPPLEGLLTAIARLQDGLADLPSSESPDFHAVLTGILGRCMPGFYAAYDRYAEAVLLTDNRRITCSKTCSACCRHFVSSVEPFELIALDQHVKTRDEYPDMIFSSYNKTMLYESLKEGGGEEDEDRALYRYFLRGKACPFLEKDGSCGVYAWRPMACRMFFAESSPRFCAGKSVASPWNRNFQVELPPAAEEALARCSRLLEHLELPEDLFPGMVAVNALFGRYEAPSPPPRPET